MKIDRNSLKLYAVTDRSWLAGATLASQVEQALCGGATFVQLREKHLSESQFLAQALELKELCRRYNVPFVINDNVEIALQSGADGVHVGQSDAPLEQVRRYLGNDKIIGVSAHTVEQAILAEKQGADYLGVGAMFATSTKLDTDIVSLQTLRDICSSVTIPVAAIGGINQDNVRPLIDTGIAGVAVVSALFAQPNIEAAAKNLLKAMSNYT